MYLPPSEFLLQLRHKVFVLSALARLVPVAISGGRVLLRYDAQSEDLGPELGPHGLLGRAWLFECKDASPPMHTRQSQRWTREASGTSVGVNWMYLARQRLGQQTLRLAGAGHVSLQ